MLVIKHGLLTTEKWFADRLRPIDALGIVVYHQVPDTRRKLGFLRKPFSTILIDIDKDPDTLRSGFARQTRAQIKKAEQLGIAAKPGSIADFVPFYKEFARAKQIRPRGLPVKSTSHITVTRAVLGGTTLVMHCYLEDPEVTRVRVLFSASTRLAADDPETPKLIGYANRYLHWQDMVLFRTKGYRVYDFGGYSTDEYDRGKQRINQFKAGFCKNVVEEYTYASVLAAMIRRLKMHARQAVGNIHVRGSLAEITSNPGASKSASGKVTERLNRTDVRA